MSFSSLLTLMLNNTDAHPKPVMAGVHQGFTSISDTQQENPCQCIRWYTLAPSPAHKTDVLASSPKDSVAMQSERREVALGPVHQQLHLAST